MKGLIGIWTALLLGIAGAFCNWFYLSQEARNFEKIEFVAVADNPINPGDVFTASHFKPMPVPAMYAGNLEASAVRWSDLGTVVGFKASRAMAPGQVILKTDLEQPPPPDVKQALGPDETVMWLPLDTRGTVVSLLKSGDMVSFIVSNVGRGPTPAASTEGPAPKNRVIGPYRILAMGNRMGTSDRMRAVGGSASQENMMAVAVVLKGGKLDTAGEELSEVLRTTNFQNVQVLLHGDVKRR